MKKILAFSFFSFFVCASSDGYAQQTPGCVVNFTVITQDALKNVRQGLPPSEVEWTTKLQKKYPGVCYVQPVQKHHAVLYISVTPDTYHGTRSVAHTSTESGPVHATVTDQTGNTAQVDGTQQATSTTYQEVPYSVDYGIFTLYVERAQGNGDIKILHTFQQKGLYSQIYGIPLGGRGHHPGHAVIEDAVKWLSAGGLSDANQGSALVPDQVR